MAKLAGGYDCDPVPGSPQSKAVFVIHEVHKEVGTRKPYPFHRFSFHQSTGRNNGIDEDKWHRLRREVYEAPPPSPDQSWINHTCSGLRAYWS